jgi:hypothetical protein
MAKEKKFVDGWSQLRRSVREMREGTYLANAQARKRASRMAWDALGFLVAIPMIGVLWWCGVRLGIVLLRMTRPGVEDSAVGFGGGPETLAGIVLFLSPVIAAIAMALWTGNVLVHAIPQARHAQAIKSDEMAYAEAQSGLMAGALLGLAIYMILVVLAILLA